MSHTRNFAVAAALAASRIIPRSFPVLGPLTRSGLMTFSAGAVLTYAFSRLAQGDGAPSRAGRRRVAETRAPYEEWTREELYELAQRRDLPGRSRLNKDGLIELIRSSE